MKRYKHIIALIIGVLAVLPVYPAMAAESEADEAGKLVGFTHAVDPRVTQLKAFLGSRNSPLAPYAGHFVSEADRLSLDWKLVAAISGLESTFGKAIPFGSYNGWGWGIPTGAQSGIAFANWKDGITTVSEGLKKRYVDRGAITVERIGSIYAASPTWALRVRLFMHEIDSYQPECVKSFELTL